jgi:polyhydroxyalkanoate synthesis repressor PhaR
MATVLIKRYANRKLYNTESSRYITLKGISELIHEGRDIQVIDNETGEDISSIVLSQILVDDQKQQRDSDAVPGRILSELIQRSGDALYNILRRGMDDAQDNITDIRENVRRFLQPQGKSPAQEPSEISRAVHESVERVFRMIAFRSGGAEQEPRAPRIRAGDLRVADSRAGTARPEAELGLGGRLKSRPTRAQASSARR